MAQGDIHGALKTIEKASQLVKSSGVFYESRDAVEITRVRLWLLQGNDRDVSRWVDSIGIISSFENELKHLILAKVYMVDSKLDETKKGDSSTIKDEQKKKRDKEHNPDKKKEKLTKEEKKKLKKQKVRDDKLGNIIDFFR